MPWKCLQSMIEQFYSTPLVGVKSRKVFLCISNQLTAWISQFHKLRKKIVNLHNSMVHEMPWKTWKTPDQMQWHKETPRMHFIYPVGSYFDNHLGRVSKCKSYRTNTAVCFFWCGHQNRFGLKLISPTDAKIFERERQATQSAWSQVQLELTIHSNLCSPKTLNTIINLFLICMKILPVIKRCARKKHSLLILDVLILFKVIIQVEMITLLLPLKRRFSFERRYRKMFKKYFQKKEKILY